MNRVSGYALDRSHPFQAVAPGATIDVYLKGGITHAVLFADSDGVTPLANPFVADSKAYYDFYVTAERVDVRFSGSGITTPFTLGDVLALPQVPSLTHAALPASVAATAGALARLTDFGGTLWMDSGVPATGYQPVGGALYNVRNFGATGDGTTVDYAAIQACITAAAGKGTVYFPGGTYYLGNNTLILPSNTALQGDGWPVTTIKSGNTMSIRATTVTRIAITGLLFDCTLHTTTALASSEIFFVSSCQYITVRDCFLYNCRDFGLVLDGCQFIEIRGNYFGARPAGGADNACQIGNDSAGFTAAYATIVNNVEFSGNPGFAHAFEATGVTNVSFVGNVSAFHDLTVFDASSVQVIGNQLASGVRLFHAAGTAPGDVIIAGNVIEAGISSGGGVGVDGAIAVVQGAVGKVIIANNLIKAAVNIGINIHDAVGRVIVTGNQIRNVAISGGGSGAGIDINAGAGLVVTDNDIDTCDGVGIRMSSVAITDFCVQGNRINNITGANGGLGIGIRIQGVGGVITGNIVTTTASHGIVADGSADYMAISGNFVRATTGNALVIGAANTHSVVNDNVDKDCVGAPNISTAVYQSHGNSGFATEASGQASVADGGTIAHGLDNTPNAVTIMVGSANIVAAVTAIGGATFTVALKDRATGAGAGATTVYWLARDTKSP